VNLGILLGRGPARMTILRYRSVYREVIMVVLGIEFDVVFCEAWHGELLSCSSTVVELEGQRIGKEVLLTGACGRRKVVAECVTRDLLFTEVSFVLSDDVPSANMQLLNGR